MFVRRFFSSVRLELQSYGDEASCLKLAKFEVPKLQNHSVLLKLVAAPVNPADRNIIQGKYPIKTQPLPFCLGNEGCFKVEEVGTEVANYAKGDTVIVLPNSQNGLEEKDVYFGCWTKHAVVPSKWLLKLPETLSAATAATIRVNPVTALCLLRKIVDLKKEDFVIQNGANSHVGQCIIQFCSSFGYKTINIISNSSYSDMVNEDLRKIGADYVYTQSEWKTVEKDVLRKIMRPKLGIDVCGGIHSQSILRALSNGGKMVTIGNMSKIPPNISVGDLIFKGKSFVGFWLTKWATENKSEFEQFLNEAICLAETKALNEPLYSEFHSLEEYGMIFDAKDSSIPSRRKFFKL